MEFSPVRPQSSLHAFEATSFVTEDSRSFLQARLELFFKTLFFLTFTFYSCTTLVSVLVVGMPWILALVDPRYTFHLLGALLSLVLWFVCRKTPRSARGLSWLDGAGLMGVLLFHKLDAFFEADPLPLLLVTNGMLISRAVIVPSSVRRTFWISLAGALPDSAVIAVMMLVGVRAHSGPVVFTLDALLWSSVSVFIATLISQVIYGLRQQVQAAQKLGQYTLIKPLGAGAMGEVFLANHALLRRHTAIKLLRSDVGGQGLERFEREVQLTSQLTHPNTIAIYDYGRTANGLFYYVMEYLEGVDLEGLLSFGPQPPARVIHILRQVCGALEEAHGMGLLHRDIKPANLFLCRRRGVPDLVKVLDFGLVKEVGAEDVSAQRVHMVVGTPLYLAPEGIVSPGKVDARADLYSLGAVGYALLTGCHVFQGSTAVEICSHHLHTQPLAPSVRLGRELPQDLCDILLRCLSKRPEQRHASARELRVALEGCADGGRWTEEDAAQWWEQRGEAVMKLARPRRDLSSSLTGTQTQVARLLERPAPPVAQSSSRNSSL